MVEVNPSRKPLILVVEDENIVALDIERGLKRLGYEVSEVVDNGRDAINSVESRRPDLILMDVQLNGDLDGIATAAKIREKMNVPVVFLTAFADEATLARATETEPYGYLLKPFEESELHTAIHVVLKKHRSIESRQNLAKQELFLSEQRFKIFVDSLQDYAVLMLDPSGNVISWNTGAEHIKGYRAEEIVGKSFEIFFTEEAKAVGKPALEIETAARLGRYTEEDWRVRKGGERFWANVTITALRDEQGHLLGFGILTRDLTSRKMSEDALKRSEARKGAVLKASLDAIISIDAQGRITEFNPAAEAVFGVSHDKAVGRLMAELIIPERFRERHEAGFQRFLKTGEGPILGKRIEMPALRADGNEFPAELSILSTRSGDELSITGFLRDITEQKKALNEIKRAKEDAEAANQAKTEFLANMSHEIRTPLGAVLGFSELLACSTLGPSERFNYISAIKRNGELLANIINDILDLSKVDAGKLEIETHEVPLAEVLSDIKAIASLQAQERGLRFSVTTSGPVPSKIQTDPLRLRQILLNIVGNAFKFTERGSVEILVRAHQEADGKNRLAFEVKDTGVGIGKESVNKLFEPFTQVDTSATRKHGGSGLGLALSRRLANLLGGTIELINSVPGKGSTFKVVIDAGKIAAGTTLLNKGELETVQIAHERPVELRLDGVKVLLVEDSIDNQFLVSRILKRAGAVAETAENGKIAIDKVHSDTYDVILMDIQMPVMDGIEATTMLRHEGLATPIIALTAHALKEQRDRTLARGFNDYITKPINRLALLESIARHAAKASGKKIPNLPPDSPRH